MSQRNGWLLRAHNRPIRRRATQHSKKILSWHIPSLGPEIAS